MGFLANKKALVLGIASKKSIAYGIAKAMQYQGAEVAITFQNVSGLRKEQGTSQPNSLHPFFKM